jgi:hypothetical protein
MRTVSRLALLMLTAILGAYPPGDPPGNGSADSVETAVHSACGTKSGMKEGNRYWCRLCEIWFFPDEIATSETG